MKIKIVLVTIMLLIFSALNTVSAANSNFSQQIYEITECNDGIDNDGDGGIDFATDDQCVGWGDLSETILEPQCLDTIDNDGDGDIDYPADAQCFSEEDNTEGIKESQCTDGIDNDGDTLIDFPDDLECSTANDDTEDLIEPQCSDGIDNDGDTLIDFPNDLDCTDSLDNIEEEQIVVPPEEPPVSSPVTQEPQPTFPGNIIRDVVTSKPVNDIVEVVENILFVWSPLGNVLGVETFNDVEELPIQSKVPVLVIISLIFAALSSIGLILINISIKLFRKYVLRIFIPEIKT